MRSNQKQKLLDKKLKNCLDAEEDWIELQNMENQCLKPDLHILDYQQIKTATDGKNKKSHKKDNQIVLSNQPIYPTSSSNAKPNVIKINGMVFQKEGVQTRSKNPKLPQMQVNCEQCGLKQSVPANSQAFICHQCQAASQCNPKYGVFICGSCQTKVWYSYGTSSLVKCTKCGTINNVPICPQNKCKDLKSKRKIAKNQQPEESYQQIISQNYEEKYLQYPDMK